MRDWSKDWEMCESATPGPWNTVDGGEVYPISGPTAYVELCRIVGLWDTSSWYDKDTAEANGKFIAAAREALPYWLQRVRKAEELLRKAGPLLVCSENVKDWCTDLCEDYPCPQKRLYDEIRAFLSEGSDSK